MKELGTIARGLVLTLAHELNGGMLFGGPPLGLILFGGYGYAEARWHRT